MTDHFARSVLGNFDRGFVMLDAALRDCPDDLWETDLWPTEAPTAPTPHGGLHGSAPWFLAYHVLFTLDYDVSGEFEPWRPPPPFDDNTWSFPNRVFTRSELLDYLAHCRSKVERTVGGLTADDAARLLPEAHRRAGTPYAVVLGEIPLHVVEHAAQVREFLTACGVRVRPLPGDRGA